MKKYFNKNIFKDKSFIKMVCFTIVLLLVLVLGNSFGYVSADEFYQYDYMIGNSACFLNTEDWEDSSVYDSSVTPRFYYSGNGTSDSTNLSNYQDFVEGFNLPNYTPQTTPIDYSGYDAYVICSFGGNIHILMFSSDCSFFISSGMVMIAPDDSYTYADVAISTSNGDWSVNHATIGRFYTDWGGGTTSSVHLDYVAVLYSNTNIWTTKTAYNTTSTYTMYQYCVGFLSESNDYFVDTNYYLYDGGTGDVNNGGLSGTGGMTAENAMYAETADWYLMNYSGNIANTYKSTSVAFTSNLNQFINDSFEDLSENEQSKYYLDFDCYSYLDFYYQNDDSLMPESDLQLAFSYGFFSGTVGGNSGSGGSTYMHWQGNWDTTDDALAQTFKHINAKTFADGGYVHTWSLYTLFVNMEPDIKVNGNNINLKQTKLLDWISKNYIQLVGTNTTSGSDFNSYKLTCTAKLIYDDGVNEYESGSYTETFNLLDGTSVIDDSSMLTNYNPYVDNNTEEGYDSLPSTGTSSSVSTSSTGNVTQTVTVTNEGASYIPSIISKLLPTSLGDTGTGLVDTFSTMVQSNGWISVMASTVPAIPSEMWTYMTNYLSITLYLLACAFVLRLILDLL